MISLLSHGQEGGILNPTVPLISHGLILNNYTYTSIVSLISHGHCKKGY